MLSNPEATLPTVAGSSESSEPLPIDESPTEELAPPRTFRHLPHNTRCEHKAQRVLAAGTGMRRRQEALEHQLAAKRMRGRGARRAYGR